MLGMTSVPFVPNASRNARIKPAGPPSTGATFEKRLTEPGNYRTELWLDVAGEQRVWILSNPIYVVRE